MINHVHYGDQGIHKINHKARLIEKNKLVCINFEIEELYNLWCLDVVQALPKVQNRNLLYFDKPHTLPNDIKEVCNLSSQKIN